MRQDSCGACMDVERNPTMVGSNRKEIQVFTSGAVVCRPTQQEADEYFRYFAVEHRDDGTIDTMTMLNLYLSPANQRAMTRAEAEQLRARYGAGHGGLLAVGDPDTVAGELKKLVVLLIPCNINVPSSSIGQPIGGHELREGRLLWISLSHSNSYASMQMLSSRLGGGMAACKCLR